MCGNLIMHANRLTHMMMAAAFACTLAMLQSSANFAKGSRAPSPRRARFGRHAAYAFLTATPRPVCTMMVSCLEPARKIVKQGSAEDGPRPGAMVGPDPKLAENVSS